MKKVVCFLLVVVMMFSMVGCASSTTASSHNSYYTDNGLMMEAEHGYTFTPNELPAAVQYNETELSLVGIDVYEDKSDVYSFYAVVTLDVSKLDDQELYWLLEEDLDIWCFVDSESNRYDSEMLDWLGTLHIEDEKQLQCVFTNLTEGAPFSFGGAELTTTVRVDQKDTYEYKNDEGIVKEYNKTNSVYFKETVPEELKSTYAIELQLYKAIAGWLDETLNALSGMLH